MNVYYFDHINLPFRQKADIISGILKLVAVDNDAGPGSLGLDVSTKQSMNTRMDNVPAALFKPREGIVREEVSGA